VKGNEIIDRVKSGDQRVLVELYRKYRGEFSGFVRKIANCDKEQSEELFQFAVVTFYENIINGKLTDLNVDVRTYLFAIGKNKAFEFNRKKSRNIFFDNLPGYDIVDTDLEDKEELLEKENKLKQLANLIDQLSERCQKILRLFYYEKKSMSEIMEIFNFKSTDVAKNEKFKCQKRLKSLHANGH
jgi:RNA polymerase sigma-70 factor (ECF subfamily)